MCATTGSNGKRASITMGVDAESSEGRRNRQIGRCWKKRACSVVQRPCNMTRARKHNCRAAVCI